MSHELEQETFLFTLRMVHQQHNWLQPMIALMYLFTHFFLSVTLWFLHSAQHACSKRVPCELT